MRQSQTLWHRAAGFLQRMGDAALARQRMDAICAMDAHLRKDIGWPCADRGDTRHPRL
jgi:hypothetical protein